MGIISGENKYSFIGSPIGALDLWQQISDIQISPDGNVLIFSDKYQEKIRKIDLIQSKRSIQIKFISPPSSSNNHLTLNSPSPTPKKDSISTIAGSGYTGSQNGNVLEATFSAPSSLAIDWINSPDIIYVADYNNFCIRKINQTSSIVSTFAGSPGGIGYQNGPLASAKFQYPTTIRYLSSSSGTKLLVVDNHNYAIRLIDISLGPFVLFPKSLSGKKIHKTEEKNFQTLIFFFRHCFNFGRDWCIRVSGRSFISCSI